MSVVIPVVFENGVFRPLEPVIFADGTRAEVAVSEVPGEKRRARFADRKLLSEFVALEPLPGDTTQDISADRNRM